MKFLAMDSGVNVDEKKIEAVGENVKNFKVGDRVFPFTEVVEAFKYLEAGKHVGKIVLEV